MLVAILIAIWTFALLVLFTDPKRTSIRWGSATAFVGGLGYFAAVIDEELYPFFRPYMAAHPLLEPALAMLSRVSSFVCQTGLPYTFLMFAVHYGEFWSRRVKRLVTYAALVPPLIMLAITPIYPVLAINYWAMVLWVIPYFLLACWILVYLYLTERDPIVRKSRFINNILVILPLSFVFISIYVMRILNNYDAWRYNIIIVAIQFVLFLLISVKYGLLGVKLRLEKRRLDSTLRAMTSGAAIVNHTIKNELGKISLYAERIRSYASPNKQQQMEEDIGVLLQSTHNILEMAKRIQGQIQDIVLKKEAIPLSSLVKRVLHDLTPYVEKVQAEVQMDLDESVTILADPVHLKEVLANLCMNALEALHPGGLLTVRMYETRKYLVVAVADTGAGISKENLPYVMDPFFSTKKQGQNYGLGLSYCYNVMQKHQGMLEIESVKGEGTTVYLYFPQKRVLRDQPSRKEGYDGQDPDSGGGR
ncbi:MAG: HAMP domain-containing histidine kinase [Brevibacillus sp.]|nr:HAMP domain-containing histidine kinase [Brevibacillus sp.]